MGGPFEDAYLFWFEVSVRAAMAGIVSAIYFLIAAAVWSIFKIAKRISQ
jgi:hypothetical protein